MSNAPRRRARPAEEEAIPEVLPAEVQPPGGSTEPPPGRKFPCKQCGAKLDFDPSSQALKCPYCGHVEEIAPATTVVEERDYETYLHKLAGEEVVLEGRSSQVRCTGCGAVVLLEDKVATDKCPFCATHLESRPEAAAAMIAPEGILPFRVSERDALAAFTRWIGSLWFAPTELKQLANLGQLSGVYLPFWTYDSMTYTAYTGERGDNYQVTETYTDTETYYTSETDSSGNARQVAHTRPVTRTRTVTKIRWYPVSGEVHHFFDDVLVCASQSVTDAEVRQLAPWDLGEVEGFQPQFLSSFKTERYAVGLDAGFVKAREIMDGHIQELCRQDIGGDHQQLHDVRTQHVGVTFKHLLMPMWIGAYRYREQSYRTIVNARTGHVIGTRPYSWLKIALLIAAIVLAIAVILVVVAYTQGDEPPSRSTLPTSPAGTIGLRTTGVPAKGPGTRSQKGVIAVQSNCPKEFRWGKVDDSVTRTFRWTGRRTRSASAGRVEAGCPGRSSGVENTGGSPPRVRNLLEVVVGTAAPSLFPADRTPVET